MKVMCFQQENKLVLRQPRLTWQHSASRRCTDLLRRAEGRQRNTPQYPMSSNNLPLMTFLLQPQGKRIFHLLHLSQVYEQREGKNKIDMSSSLVLTRWQKYHPKM